MNYFKNQFRSQKNIRRGHIAKDMGDLFENMLRTFSARQSITCTRIPSGCRTVSTRAGMPILKRVPTPFDFILTKNGLAACIDCKTIESGNFSHSMLTQHQVDSLVNIFDSKIPAGYLIWFRDVDVVTFFQADKLYHLKRRESLKHTDGIIVGTSQETSLVPILKLFEATV